MRTLRCVDAPCSIALALTKQLPARDDALLARDRAPKIGPEAGAAAGTVGRALLVAAVRRGIARVGGDVRSAGQASADFGDVGSESLGERAGIEGGDCSVVR